MGYSKLIEGRVERLNVIDEMEHAIKEVFPPEVATGVKIHRNFGAALPALLVQRTHLEEVLVNLLKNARDAMNDKGNIWINIQYGEGYSVVFKIRDDGPGIAPEHHEKIFEAYFSTKEHGTGLGMPIVKNCVEMYGGKIQFESSLRTGTEFTIRFPARTALNISQ
jgi:signal transduction histidine kinase